MMARNPDTFDYEHKLVELRFTPANEALVRNGSKTATTRRSQHGLIGSIFRSGESWYELIAIVPCLLGFAADHFYTLEGYFSPKSFIERWAIAYGISTTQLNLQQPVYVHIFRFIPGQLARGPRR
jgi:hypothetical protein